MRHNRRLRWVAIPLAAVVAIVLAGCSQLQLHGYMPGFKEGEPPATNHTERVEGLWSTAWIVLLVVGLVVWCLLIWTLIVYRRRKGQTGLPRQIQYNMPIEIFYTIVPIVLIFGFFAFTARDQEIIEAQYDHPDLTVHVYAKQWAWDFNYVDDDVYEPSVQADIKNGPDGTGAYVESEMPTLWLPVDQKVNFILDSRDVAHSFWVPGFLYKKDVLPGHTNHIALEPQRVGTYMGKCAELCGEYHSSMLFDVKVVSQQDFDKHMQDLRAQGYTGQLDKNFDRNLNSPGPEAPQANE